MLGDKAYDSTELREELNERGTKPIIPNKAIGTTGLLIYRPWRKI